MGGTVLLGLCDFERLPHGLWDGLFDQYTGLIMGLTAENVAEKYNISREDQDEFAYTSQMRAKKAMEANKAAPEAMLLPPEAKPGECYARVFIPPTYRTASEKILKHGASERLEVVPAKYEWIEKKVLVTEASERLEVVPAKYQCAHTFFR